MALIDSFGRRIDYVRISVTDRCDLRCAYCIPKGFKAFDSSAGWLGFDELLRVAAAFADLGVSKFRITGGEPLLRRGVVDFIRHLSALPGVEDVSLSTNGTQLASMAHSLRAAGVHRLNVSLDSVSRACVAQISGHDSLPSVLAGLIAAQQAGFQQIKINMVPLTAWGVANIRAMMSFCMACGLVLRLIEVMPMGLNARAQAGFDLSTLLPHLAAQYGLQPTDERLGNGPAQYWHHPGSGFKLGLITPLSQHFCATCNRVRLSADGTIYTCLGQESKLSLKPMMRQGCTDFALKSAIVRAIRLKPKQHDFATAPEKIVRIMAKTGG